MPQGDSTRRGFIITPFLDEVEWLTELIRGVGDDAGVVFERADDIFAPGVIINQILTAIDESDVIVAVTTGRNPNVFFELGYAWLRHRPILLAETTDDMPFDVASWRHLLYGDGQPCADPEELRHQLTAAVRHVLEEGPRVPQGRVVSRPPRARSEARVTARLQQYGKSRQLVLRNTGAVDVTEVTFEVPEEAKSFHVHTGDDLPIDILRPGESVPLPASVVMGGGRRVFDIVVRGTTPDGESREWPSKIAL